jgi:uncharacterized protein YfaS (alpha-2-macroglobulin family)
MRAAKVAAIVGIMALTVGVFTGVALAGKKKKTSVVFFNDSPKFNKSGKVTAKGSINTASACEPGRSMRLQVLDSNGVVLATLDGQSTDSVGNWSLSGQLAKNVPAGTNTVRVKVKKKTVGKFVCQAGVSISVPVPAT